MGGYSTLSGSLPIMKPRERTCRPVAVHARALCPGFDRRSEDGVFKEGRNFIILRMLNI